MLIRPDGDRNGMLIRPASGSDKNYLIKSWVRSLRSQFPFSQMSPNAISKYSKRVEALIDSAVTIVTCDPLNEDVVYGFACGESGKYLGVESPTLHYVWVRKAFRQNGLGTKMVRALFPGGERLIYTHITKAIHCAGLKECWNLGDYDPYYVEGALYSQARKFDARAISGHVPCGSGAALRAGD